MADFDKESIEVRYYTDLWGVYSFNFSPGLPTGSSISLPISVRAFVGNVTPSSTLASETEINDLIDPAFGIATAIGPTNVILKLQYPIAVDYKGEKATLIFELDLASGAMHPFYFQYVHIK